VDRVVKKGQFAAAYSAFEGRAGTMGPFLGDLLREQDISSVDIVGIATDHCVLATALDSVRQGFNTYVLLDYCAAVSPETEVVAQQQMADAGVVLVTNSERGEG
jgi:nicotinamidase/pyrazinamidase